MTKNSIVKDEEPRVMILLPLEVDYEALSQIRAHHSILPHCDCSII